MLTGSKTNETILQQFNVYLFVAPAPGLLQVWLPGIASAETCFVLIKT